MKCSGCSLMGLFLLMAMGAYGQAAPTYAKDIRPILKERCAVCHNQTALTNLSLSGGLALDTYAAVARGVAGATPRPVYVAGKAAASELVKRLEANSPTRLMPKGGPALPAAQIALFRHWIDAGALSGDLSAEKSAPRVTTASLPMPANLAAEDVLLPTLLKPGPDLVDKTAPKDAVTAYALKVGPLSAVSALGYSPDGKLLAVGSYRAVTLWSTATGKPLGCITHLMGAVQSVVFRPDGTLFAVAGGAPGAVGEVRVFDVKTLAPVGASLEGHADVVLSVAWSPDGNRLATASQDKTARLWEWPSGKELRAFKDHSDAVTGIAFAPDGKSVYTASLDHNVRRFDAETGAVMRIFTGHADVVNALAVSPDGHRVVTSGAEPNLRWWNPDDGNTVNNNGGHNAAVNSIVFSKDGKLVASASADKTVRIWDGGSTGPQRALEGDPDWVYAVAISPDNKFTAGGGADGVVRLWESATGRLRLLLLAWPSDPVGSPAEWLTLIPEGYYDGSANWTDHLRPTFGGKPAPVHLAEKLHALRQSDMVSKAWQDAPLDPANLATPPPAVVAPKK